MKIVQSILLLLHLSTLTKADEGVLYQSDFKNQQDWVPVSSLGRSKNGWQAVPTAGVYRTCDIDGLSNGENLHNMLTANFSKSPRSPKIHVEADLKITECRELSTAGIDQSGCKEEVKVEVRFQDANLQTQVQSLTFFNDLNVQSINFPEGVSHYTINLIDNGVCADLSSFKITVFFCPAKIEDLIKYSETMSTNQIVRTSENCVDNAVSEKPVKGFCLSGGQWKETSKDYCMCKAGYEPNSNRTSCQGCGEGFFKEKPGNQKCSQCPANSDSTYIFATECFCIKNFARENPNDPTLPCKKQPSKPRSLSSEATTHSITLKWLPPIYAEDYSDSIYYSVHCQDPQDACRGLQGIATNNTQITVRSLKDDTTFTWRVCAENSVSRFITSESNCEYRKQRTKKMVKIDRPVISPDGDQLIWSEPEDLLESTSTNSRIYIVRTITADQEKFDEKVNSSFACLHRKCRYHLPQTLLAGDYEFQVGYGNSPTSFSERITVSIPSDAQVEAQLKYLLLTVGVLFAFLLMILAVCIGIFCCCREKLEPPSHALPKHHSLNSNLYAVAEQYNYNSALSAPSMFDYNLKVGSVVPVFGGAFIEPSTHPDPELLLFKYSRELNDVQVQSTYLQLKGMFSDAVELGTYEEENGKKCSVGLQHFMPLETGSDGSCGDNAVDVNNVKLKRELVIAAATCAQLIHPNVLSIVGFIKRDDESLTVVTEHAEMGALLNLLQQGQLSNISQLVHMARGIACGMRYLQEEGYVHKVLKSANVLVSQNLVCKISGFSQRARLESVEKSNSVLIPDDLVPWTAPEVLVCHQFSWASDVWSFGILLWEMLSQGCVPYYDHDIAPAQVFRALEAGFRLPPPMGCPQLAYQLMNQCWVGDGIRRPSFAQVVQVLEALMRKPLDMTPQDHMSFYDTGDTWISNSGQQWFQKPGSNSGIIQHRACSPVPSTCATPVSALLAQLSLQKYESLFLMTRIYTLEDLSTLSGDDLRSIGITTSKHRKKIMQACRNSKSLLASNQGLTFDHANFAPSASSSSSPKCWTSAHLSPGPRDQLMSQYV